MDSAMRRCCRPGEGCNARHPDEPCALTELRRAETPTAQRALDLWERYERSDAPPRSRRFLRRAYERARDDALPAWTPWRDRDRAA
jgi:hypothetical protein